MTKAQRHNSDIRHDRHNVYFNVDLAQRGLGGDDTWGRPPHDPYILDAKQYLLSLKQNYQADDDIAKMIETRLEKLNTESKL